MAYLLDSRDRGKHKVHQSSCWDRDDDRTSNTNTHKCTADRLENVLNNLIRLQSTPQETLRNIRAFKHTNNSTIRRKAYGHFKKNQLSTITNKAVSTELLEPVTDSTTSRAQSTSTFTLTKIWLLHEQDTGMRKWKQKLPVLRETHVTMKPIEL